MALHYRLGTRPQNGSADLHLLGTAGPGLAGFRGSALHNVLFAFHNLETGEFHTSLCYMTGKLKTEGSAPDAKDFWFKYAIDDGKNGFTTEYDYQKETWRFAGYNTKDDKWNQPFKLDMRAT